MAAGAGAGVIMDVQDNSDWTSDMEGDFHEVKHMKRRKMQKQTQKKIQREPVKVTNSFEILANVSEQPVEKQPPRPKVVVVHNKCSRDFVRQLNGIVGEGNFSVRYRKDDTAIFCASEAAREAVMKSLRLGRTEFHTYTSEQDRRRGFVVEGLPEDYTAEEVKAEMAAQHKLEIYDCHRMRGTSIPKFLVTVAKNYNLAQLREKCRTLSGIRIFFGELRNKREMGQCRNCQMWGHGKTNCFAKTKCVKCGLGHASSTCNITKDNGLPVKCANCNGEHTAGNRECPVYLVEVSKRRRGKKPPPPAKQRYVPAPPPETNAWNFPALPTPRGQQQQIQSQQQQIQGQPQSKPGRWEQGSRGQQQEQIQSQPQSGPGRWKRNANDQHQHQQQQFLGGSEDLKSIADELRELRQLINIPAMLAALRTLKNNLLHCRNDPLGKLEAVQRFAEDLEHI